MARKKICFVVSQPGTALSFLSTHIEALAKFYDVWLVANYNGQKQINIPGLMGTHHVTIERAISLKHDLKAVRELAAFFKHMDFDAVHSVTPKAGLITALASRLAGTHHRIHIFTGQVWATRKGMFRTMLKTMDRLIACLNNHILVDGHSQMHYIINQGIVSAKKARVLGAGSICGADTDRFTPYPAVRTEQRRALNLTDNQVVYCFMGRLNRDKGIYELLSAFDTLASDHPDAFLLIFGRDEENCLNNIESYPNIVPGQNYCYYGPTSTPELSLQAADIFCLPSYREGFGMSVVEASSLGLPVICSDAYGLADTIADDITGIRCKVADKESLLWAMTYMFDHPDRRKEMGANGRRRVLELFTGEKIIGAWVDYYKSILN